MWTRSSDQKRASAPSARWPTPSPETVHGRTARDERGHDKAIGARSCFLKRGGEPFPRHLFGSLWLLPSGPDQIHDLAMRGDPPYPQHYTWCTAGPRASTHDIRMMVAIIVHNA